MQRVVERDFLVYDHAHILSVVLPSLRSIFSFFFSPCQIQADSVMTRVAYSGMRLL